MEPSFTSNKCLNNSSEQPSNSDTPCYFIDMDTDTCNLWSGHIFSCLVNNCFFINTYCSDIFNTSIRDKHSIIQKICWNLEEKRRVIDNSGIK